MDEAKGLPQPAAPSPASESVATAQPSLWRVGLQCRCPRCGKGRLFRSFLAFADRCTVCGADFRVQDAGDGPAVFVILIAGAILAPLAILFLLWTKSALLTALIFMPLSLGLCLWMLPVFKATLFALQWRFRAQEARLETAPGDRQSS